jgi:hypothetical protein
MAYQINVTDHGGGSISVSVVNTEARKDASLPLYISEMHQFSDRRAAFEYGEQALAEYIRKRKARTIAPFEKEGNPALVKQAYDDGVINGPDAMSRLMFDCNMRLHEAEILLYTKRVSK